jgi:hypothetical protein
MEYPINEALQNHIWTQDHSIEIKATAKAIWPWLAQMGNGRAGWYSYDWLDNLGRKSSDVIDPKLIAIEKGQKIPLATISDFAENKFITYQFGSTITFTYYLQELNQHTRLWTRLRIPHASWLLKSSLRIGHKIMQDKQFLEIKKRVENQTGHFWNNNIG